MAEIGWTRSRTSEASARADDLRRTASRYFDWETWLTFALALAATLTVSAGLEASGWSDDMPALALVSILALLAAMFTARSGMPVFGAWPLAIFLGALITFWQVLVMVGPGAFDQRIDFIYERFNRWFFIAFNGGVSNDSLPFNTLMVGLTWLGTYIFGWSVFRWHHAWVGLIPGGVALFLGLVFVDDALATAVALYVLFGFLLVMRTNLTKQIAEWKAMKVSYPPFISLSFLHFTAWGLLALLAFAWIVPTGPFATPRVVDSVVARLETYGVDFVRLAGPLHVNKVVPVHSYTGVLPFQGSVDLRERELLLVEVQDPTLQGPFTLRGTVYEEYGSGGWVAGERENITPVTGTGGRLHQSVVDNEVPGEIVPLDITLQAKSVVGTVMFSPGQPLSFDSATNVEITSGSQTRIGVGELTGGEDGRVSGRELRELSDQEILNQYVPEWLLGTSVNRDDGGFVTSVDGFNSFEQVIPDAAVLDPGDRVKNGESYSVTGFVPTVSEDELRDAGEQYPDWVAFNYLQLPESLPFRVNELAFEQAGSEPTPLDKAQALETYLRDFYPVNYEIGETPPGRDTVDWFLFDARQGFFNYHASAMAVMLRTLDVPARLAVGFVFEESDIQGDGAYMVRDRNAYAWTEVYFPGYGWIPFNPSPDRAAELTPTEREEPLPLGPGDLSNFPGPGPGADPIFDIGDGELPQGGFDDLLSGGSGTSSADYTPWILAAAGAIAVLVVASAGYGWRRSVVGLPYPQALWEKTVRLATLAGHGPTPGQTPNEFARDLGREFREYRVIEDISQVYTESRFGNREITEAKRYDLEHRWPKFRNALVGRIVARALKRKRPNELA